MCVGFLYTLVVSQPSGSLKTAVSRKASLLSFSVSMVKQMEGCWLFKCCQKSQRESLLLSFEIENVYCITQVMRRFRFVDKPRDCVPVLSGC